MTTANHALNRVLAHLIGGKPLTRPEALELVDAVRDECRALAWETPEAVRAAADAQSWHILRAAVLPTVDDPHVWDDGASEAEVLAAWVTRQSWERAERPKFAEGGPAPDPTKPFVLDDEDTRPMVTPTDFLAEAAGAPRRACGGAAGQSHRPHMFERAGAQFFCPGAGVIPAQPGPDTSEQDKAS